MGYRLVGAGANRVVLRADDESVRLHVERGLSVGAAELASHPEQAIFLDGVYAGAPFVDNARRRYALDHHQGCVRAFTLATCEQAAVMVAMGLPLGEGVWHMYVNEPDLDALLAAWVLMNHRELCAEGLARLGELMPLLRVEGNIDTHGYELPALSGVTAKSYALHKARLDRLRARECAVRAAGRWEQEDVAAYACERLGAIDHELFGRGRREAHLRSTVRALGVRARKVAVLLRSPLGIYEVEEALRTRYGDALAVIVLERGRGHVTLLQTDPFLPRALGEVYPLLDAADPNADAVRGNTWGGADEIGGSPRKTGTALTGEQILHLVARLYALEEVTTSPAGGARAAKHHRG